MERWRHGALAAIWFAAGAASVAQAAGAPDCQPKVEEISAGARHTCARLADGTVKCWGDPVGTTVPIAVPELEGVRKLRAYGSLTCGLDGEGRIRCRNFAGPLPRWAVGLMDSFGRVEDFAFGGGILARKADGTVLWFHALAGTLDSVRPRQYAGKPRAQSIKGISDAVSVRGDDAAGCVLRRSGGRQCWTQGIVSSQPGPAQGELPGVDASIFGDKLAKARLIAPFDLGLCAVLADGTAACWENLSALQDPEVETYAALGKATDIVANTSRICVLLAGGGVACRLYTEDKLVRVGGLEGVAEVRLGHGHACVRLRDGGVKCWGTNEGGQLGDGTIDDRARPVAVAWCASDPAPVEHKPPPDVALVLSFETTSRCETCADYRLDVYEDGTVIYHGRSGGLRRGARRKTISVEKIAELRAAFEKARFTRLPRACCHHPDYDDGDLEAKLVYVKDGRKIRVGHMHESDEPQIPALFKLEDRIDAILGTGEWTGRQPPRAGPRPR